MNVLCIPDQHHPWAHKGALAWTVEVARHEKPDVIVNLGDALDLYSLSKYPRSHNLHTPADEFRLGFEGYSAHWAALRKAAPKARCIVLDSNHMGRLHKRIIERLPEVESLIGDPFKVPGVESVERITLDGVLYEHGFRSKPDDHGKKNRQSTVHAHLHSATLHWFNLEGRPHFNLNCGWLGDTTAPVFKYRQSAVDDWQLACGGVRDGAPWLELYPTKQNRRAA